MPNLTFVPSRERFRDLAKEGNVVPLVVDFVADAETPASAYQKLDTGGHSFLFESAEQTEQAGRYSFLGLTPRLIVCGENGAITVAQNGRGEIFAEEEEPLAAVEQLMARFKW